MLQCNGILLINTEGLNLSAIWENINIYKKEKVESRRLSHNDSLCYKPNENKTRAIWRRGCWPPGGGGTWVFFGWVCAAQDSILAPRSKKISSKIDIPF